MHTHAQNPEWSNHRAVDLNAILAIQKKCRGLCPKDARAVLVEAFPKRSDSFFKRKLPEILSLSPEAFLRVVGHPDPTALKAINNIMRERAE